jgi:DNA-binding HxlR family transcriptional regulator
MKHHRGCPVQAAVEVLRGKWKVQILWHLSGGELRFAELRKKLGTVSEKVLAEQLRQLEAHGVIARDVSESVPPAVTYSLNEAGRRLAELMGGLCDWGSAHFGIEPTLPRRATAAT